jgi:hypothetical protein
MSLKQICKPLGHLPFLRQHSGPLENQGKEDWKPGTWRIRLSPSFLYFDFCTAIIAMMQKRIYTRHCHSDTRLCISIIRGVRRNNKLINMQRNP